jgi:hypothetical protein
MTAQDTYITEAIESAAATLLWQAPDATEDGNGFPIGDGGNEYSARVIEEVPYLTEAVTAFVRDNWDVLTLAGVTAGQCGHDIILTANGHGTGFWDRGLPDVQMSDDTWHNAGDYLTEAAHGYSFDAEFALDEDGGVAWLMVENTVLVDELGWASEPGTDDVADAAQLSRTESSACDG